MFDGVQKIETKELLSVQLWRNQILFIFPVEKKESAQSDN